MKIKKLDEEKEVGEAYSGRNVRSLSSKCIPLESEEQEALVEWLNIKKILHFAIPNGGYRTLLEAKALKRQGVVPGVPDLFIPVARKGFLGLFIELKRVKGGVITVPQSLMLKRLNFEGYKAIVCYGSYQAMVEIEEYFSDLNYA